MFDKKVHLIAIILIVIGLCITCTAVSSVEKTKFKTDFMEGTFVGKVSLEYDSESYMHSYVDSQHGITYNISTVDDTVSLMEIYELQGVTNPTKEKLNGNDWNIYHTQAISEDDGREFDIIICQSQGKKQGYIIYAIFEEGSYDGSLSTSKGSYADYVKPLLESITLKECSNVPKINEEFGLSEKEFQQQLDKIHAYKNGDTSALDDDSSANTGTSSSSSSSSGSTYWASSNSDKFHHPGCQWAQKISSKNKVVFHSRDEAINSGYHPCSVCSP